MAAVEGWYPFQLLPTNVMQMSLDYLRLNTSDTHAMVAFMTEHAHYFKYPFNLSMIDLKVGSAQTVDEMLVKYVLPR